MSSGRAVSYQLSEEQRAAVREQVRKRRAAAFEKRRTALESKRRERQEDSAPPVSAPAKPAEVDRGRHRKPAARQEPVMQQKPSEKEGRERTRARERADTSLKRLAAAYSADPEIRRLRGLIDTEDPTLLQGLVDQIDDEVQRICKRRRQQAKLEEWSVTVQTVRDDARAAGLKDEAERLGKRLERAAAGVAGDDPRAQSELDDLERQARALEEGYESLLADAQALDLISKVWAEQGYELLQTDDHRSFLAHGTTHGSASFVVSCTGDELREEMVETPATGATTYEGRARACEDAVAVEKRATLHGVTSTKVVVEDPHHVRPLVQVLLEPGAEQVVWSWPDRSRTQLRERQAGLGR